MIKNKSIYDSGAHIKNISIFKQLEVFVKVVECGSFSEAARHLDLTPSAVSRSMSKLEDHLGATLLNRTTRSVVLTEPGHYLYKRALHLFSHLDESLSNTTNFQSHPQGQLKITSSFAFGHSHLMSLFSEYKKAYADVNLQLDLSDQLVNLNETDFDIALRITYSPPENYALRKICPIRWAYCASPEYLKKRGEPKTLLDLESHDCLVYPRVSDAWKYRDENGELKDLQIKNVIQANSSATLLQAALLSEGIVYLPTYVLGDCIQSGRLKPLLLDEQINDKDYFLYALYFPSRYRTLKVRTFIDFILEKLSPEPPWDEWMFGAD